MTWSRRQELSEFRMRESCRKSWPGCYPIRRVEIGWESVLVSWLRTAGEPAGEPVPTEYLAGDANRDGKNDHDSNGDGYADNVGNNNDS